MTSADSLCNEGARFHQIGDLDAAKIHYLAALRSNPKHSHSLLNLCSIMSQNNNVAGAAAIMARAVDIAPNNGQLWSNYGSFLKRLERYEDARGALVQATSLSPDFIGAWHNLLLLELREGNIGGAIDCYNQIKALGGDSPTIQNDLAHIYLAAGDLEYAFEIYESRWHILTHQEPWDLHLPEWQGEDLKGKRLLVHQEQGYGDTVMTSRFIKDLVKRGAKVTFAVEGALIGLFESQDWEMDTIDLHILREKDAERFDFHSPLYSVMRWLEVRKENINPSPFINPPKITVPSVYNEMTNVGICWFSGRRGNDMDWRRRVSPLELWLPLAEVPSVQLWSLCPGDEAQSEIVRLGAEGLVIDEVTKFFDFAETASFINKLDLVISVDTAVAHLAASMGKPTWMLSQFTPCWRWWDLEAGTGKPWYETMEILSQPAPGDWKTQLEECERNLRLLTTELVSERVSA